MKYVVKPGPQTVEVYKLDGFSIGRTPIAIVEGTRIDFVGGFSLLGDSEFIAAVLSLGLETFHPVKTTDVPTPRHLEEVYGDAEVVKTINIPTPQQLEDSRAALVGYGWKHPRTFPNLADVFPVQALPDRAVPIFVKEPESVKEEPESTARKFPPVQSAVYSALSTGPCTKPDIMELLKLNNQKVAVALSSLMRAGLVSKDGETYSLIEKATEPEQEEQEPLPPVRQGEPLPEFEDAPIGGPPGTKARKVLLIGGIADEKKLKLFSDNFTDFSFEWIPVYHDSARSMKRLNHIKPDYDRVILFQGLTSHSVADKINRWCRKTGVKLFYGDKGGLGSVKRSLGLN